VGGAGGTRSIAPLVIVAAAVIGLAIVKPWPGSGPTGAAEDAAAGGVPRPSSTPAGPASSSARPIGVASPASTDPVYEVCLGTDAWRVASVQLWAGRMVRTWSALTPLVDAHGPTDPAIPAALVVGEDVSGVGYCAPAGTSAPSAAASASSAAVQSGTLLDDRGPGPVGAVWLDAWRMEGSAAVPFRVVRSRPAGLSPLGGLFLPASASSGEPTREWPTGRYVFVLREIRTRGATFWWTVDVMTPQSSQPGDSNQTWH
jgi:hypothetical protein